MGVISHVTLCVYGLGIIWSLSGLGNLRVSKCLTSLGYDPVHVIQFIQSLYLHSTLWKAGDMLCSC